jgi:hypothetical protein
MILYAVVCLAKVRWKSLGYELDLGLEGFVAPFPATGMESGNDVMLTLQQAPFHGHFGLVRVVQFNPTVFWHLTYGHGQMIFPLLERSILDFWSSLKIEIWQRLH